MDERIVEQLKLLDKYLQYLDTLSQKSKDEFLKDVIVQGACERYLQLAIECSLNIGSRIIALEASKANINVPESYADIFGKLGELGVLSQEFALNLMAMARFRNRLVHAYWQIDPEGIYKILRENRREIHEFKNKIIEYLQKVL